MTHYLFPDENPPPFPSGADVPTACIWMLAVMDPEDGSRKFIASVLTYYFDRGYVTEKQMDALRSVASKIIKRYLDRDLQAQGASPAPCQTLDFGEVIQLSSLRADQCEVLE